MQKIKCFVLAVIAGVFISIGGCVYLLAPDKIVGSLLFAVGLYSIVCFGLNLFTGKVGYWANKPLSFGADLAVILLGNLAGTLLAGCLVTLTRQHAALLTAATPIVSAKLCDNPVSIFILSVFCGILMYTAVELYARTKNPIGVFVCVSVFILCGFEHCVANMFYITAAGAWSIKAAVYMLIMIAGNSAGGLAIPLSVKYIHNR